LCFAIISTVVIGYIGYRQFPRKAPPPSRVPLTALYIGCEWDRIPINIQAGSVVHVMWLDPSILSGNPNIPFLGPFDDIKAPPDKAMTWPTKSDGRWMTHTEVQEAIKNTEFPATPYAFRCTLSNYGISLDEITAQLIVDTSDKKRHIYGVPFNPSVLGHPFEFYMVNKCSSGIVPIMIQWGDKAGVRVIGETILRSIPLQFERKAFPSNLAVGPGASRFMWNDRKGGCVWNDEN
jgi:hypothetical protein